MADTRRKKTYNKAQETKTEGRKSRQARGRNHWDLNSSTYVNFAGKKKGKSFERTSGKQEKNRRER